MRAGIAAALAGIAAISLAARAAENLPAGVSPEDAHAGCIRTDLRRCMISLGSALWFDMNEVAAIIAKRNELDVNGRTAHRNIGFLVAVPGQRQRFRMQLTLASPAPNDTVTRVEIDLPTDLELARTQSEYDSTFFYDAVAPVLGKACPNLQPLALYRFFENEVKPRETTTIRDLKRGIFNYSVLETDTGKIPFCGVGFRFRRHAQWEGPPDAEVRRATKASTMIEIE